jgi:nitroimidazol reductase NimA-like FMN-containing flavoprotein (pyridoxamine 5'-phosphate oxidase superfamily)
MSMETYGQWMGTPMDDRDIDDLLVLTGWGIITMAADDEPYSIPISFGYDGEDVYFTFIRDSPTNTKFEFVSDGKTARLLVTKIGGRFDWQSIAVTGTLRSVDRDSDDWETLVDTLDDNAWFSSDFERADSVDELQGWRIEIDQIRGLQVRADED